MQNFRITVVTAVLALMSSAVVAEPEMDLSAVPVVKTPSASADKDTQTPAIDYHARWREKQALKLAQEIARKSWEQKQLKAKHIRAWETKKAKADAIRAKYRAMWLAEQARLAAWKEKVKKAEITSERVIWTAKKYLGRRYVWGGETPKTGFDCSGLTHYAIRTAANVEIPRTAFEQYKSSQKVHPTKAQRGDLVFFVTRGRQVSHVGLYLGDNKFLHAPRRGQRIKVSELKGFWRKNLVGFGRVPGATRL